MRTDDVLQRRLLLDENGQAARRNLPRRTRRCRDLSTNRDLRTSEILVHVFRAGHYQGTSGANAPGVLGIDVLSSEEAIDMPSANPTVGLPMPQRKSAPVIDDSDLPNVIPGGLSFRQRKTRSEADRRRPDSGQSRSQSRKWTNSPAPTTRYSPTAATATGPDLAAHGCRGDGNSN